MFLLHTFFIDLLNSEFIRMSINGSRTHSMICQWGSLSRSCIYKYRGNKEADNHSDVGTTGLEGFLPPFLSQVLKRVQDDSIGDEQEQKHDSADQPSIGQH